MMTRVSHCAFGVQSNWPLPENASRESMSLPRQRVGRESVARGPGHAEAHGQLVRRDRPGNVRAHVEQVVAAERARRALPPHFDSDGRPLVMLMRPPSALRPKSALCGPRTNSIWPMSIRSKLVDAALNCGTPSTYVVTPGLAGLAPTPRMRGLLSLRAENSVKMRVRRKHAGVAHERDAGGPDQVFRNGGDADGQLRRIRGFFLGGDEHGRTRRAHGRLGL